MGLSSCRSLLWSCPLRERAQECHSHVGTVAPTKPTLVLVALLKYIVEAWLVLQAMAHCTGTWWHGSGRGSTPWAMLSTVEGTNSMAKGGWDSQRGEREWLQPAGI